MDFIPPPLLASHRYQVYNEAKEVDAMNRNNPIAEESRTDAARKEREQAFIAEVDALIEENLPALKELAK